MSLQALSFMFIVAAFGTGIFPYLLHICDGIELPFLAVCLVLSSIMMSASGSELVVRLWQNYKRGKK